jgi:hypothetical protein
MTKEIEPIVKDIGNIIGRSLPENMGFALFVFTLGEGGHMTYISSANRKSMIKAVREWLSKVED